MTQDTPHIRTDSDMLIPSRPPTPEMADQLSDVGKATYRLVKDVVPAAAGPAAMSYAANVELVNAVLATVSGVLGAVYLIIKIWLAIKHRNQRAAE